MCYGGLGILLEARWQVFLVERVTLASVSVVCHDRGNRSDPQVSFSRLFLFASLFWYLLEHEVYKKQCSVADLVRPMMMKRIRRWHWLIFCWCLSFLHMFSVLTVNACVQLGMLIVKCLLDYTYLSRQTNKTFASALNYFFCPVLA